MTPEKITPGKPLGLALVSAALVSAVTLLEGTRTVPYEDIAYVLTVCQGYAGPGIVRGKTYSKAECAALTQNQLREHGQAVLRCVTVPFRQNEYDAFTLFTYNVGSSAFCHSSVLKKFNQSDKVGACNTQNGASKSRLLAPQTSTAVVR